MTLPIYSEPAPVNSGAVVTAPGQNNLAAGVKQALAAVAAIRATTTVARTADYTLAAADAGTMQECSKATQLVVTVPNTVSAPSMPANATIKFTQVAAGQVAVVGAPGVLLRVPPSPSGSGTRGQWSELTLRRRSSTDEWVLTGDSVVASVSTGGTTPVDPLTPPSAGSARTAISTASPVYAPGASYYSVDSSKTTLTGAKPTNTWFMNFMLGTGHEAVNMFPYDLKVTTLGLDMCVPVLNTSSPTSVLATMLQNFSMRATAGTNTQQVTAFSDLGCRVQWTATSGSMSAFIVRGMAYVTMSYTAMTPLLVSQNAITAVNGSAVGATGTFTGTKFKFVLNNGQTWILYTSSSVTLTLSTANTLTAGATFTGTFRLAYLPTSGDETTLDGGAAMIPTGGAVDYTVGTSTATETFTWSTSGTGTLLMYALPHHQDQLVSPTYPGAQITTLRGVMKAVSGLTWTLTVTIPTVSWNNANPINSSRLAAIQAALAADKSFVPQVNDPYFGGKQLAKSARLALIADQVGDTAARDQLLTALKNVMNLYLTGQLPTVLRYDTVWGGIVSQAGLTNQDVDFGNGRYNDHHFHYGYTIYAAAVIAKFDAAWAGTYRTRINDLVRDIANPSASDPYFTPMRNYDWFEGHSWAAGNFEFGDNRNQESSSEAVNAWYGLYLWGVASGQSQLANMGRFLFANEVASAQKYWQIKSTDTIYPAPFNTHATIGILWSNKVDYATFFGAQDEYIIGIQILPVTPATEVLIPDAWVNDRWASSIAPLWTRTSVWRAEVVNGGSGYVGANTSPTGQQYTNGMIAT